MNKYEFDKIKRLSIPAPNRTLTSVVRKWGGPILICHQHIKDHIVREKLIRSCREFFLNNYNPENRSHVLLNDETILNLYSSALILNWISGVLLGNIDKSSSLSDAEQWFLGKNSKTNTFSSCFDNSTQNEALFSLRKFEYSLNFLDIMPYITETFETKSELLFSLGKQRTTKRTNGIYYTPSDISDFVVNTLLTLRSNTNKSLDNIKWLDPACGTGCFLVSVFHAIIRRTHIEHGPSALNYIKNCLFGIDNSPLALQSVTYILMVHSLWNASNYDHIPVETLQSIGRNFHLQDSTSIESVRDLSKIIPSLYSGADFVLSNPPYSKKTLQASPNCFHLNHRDIYPYFVKMIELFSNSESGAGCMVVPLSICYNTQKDFRNLRDYIKTTSGHWYFLNFDRTPDSLFGDDVKTRNTIVFFQKAIDSKFYSSYLLRWNSRNREDLFRNITMSEFSISNLPGRIPKIGSEFGNKLYNTIQRRCSNTLSSSIKNVSPNNARTELFLRNQNTAYNWLPFEILNTRIVPDDAQLLKYRYWQCKDQYETKAAFALLQSRLSYWLWRIMEDGFHLNANFILSLPFSVDDFTSSTSSQLSMLGEHLWEEAKKHPTINKNADVLSVTYCPYLFTSILDDIDALICSEYGLPTGTIDYLKAFINNTVIVGREEEMGLNPAMKKYYGSL